MRELHSRERRFVGEAVHGMIRWRRRLAFVALGVEEAPPLPLYLAWLASEGATLIDAAINEGRLDTRRLRAPDAVIDQIADELSRIGVRHSFPNWLVARLREAYGDETEALCAALNQRAPLVLRANLLKNSRVELLQALTKEKVTAQPLGLGPLAVGLEQHLNAFGLQAFTDGRFEVQDVGSQILAELCAPPPRGVVVDACAGAGGKTLALGALLGNRGRITSLDVHEKRLVELRDRARRAGLTNQRSFVVDEAEPLRELGDLVGAADRVLCDAPCSGSGALRRNPEGRWRLTSDELEALPAKQRGILEAYAPLVRVGGRLIYGTCSILPEENDAVADAFLAAHPGFVEMPLKEILGGVRAAEIGDGTRLRLLPNRHDSDGFFAAVFRRVG